MTSARHRRRHQPREGRRRPRSPGMRRDSLMDPFRIALANVRFPATPEGSVTLAERAIERASRDGARIVCFPECFVPVYRGIDKPVPPPDRAFLERAWSIIAEAAARANLAVVLGTE